MKLIKPSVCIKEQDKGLEGVLKQIEWVGRHCYMSMDKITEDSAKEFVDKLIKSKHLAMLEHGTVYLKVPVETWQDCWHEWIFMFPDVVPWISIDCDGKYHYITTNLRHIIEGEVGMKTVSTYWCEPTECHEKRYTLKFTTSIGITRELIRHKLLCVA